MYSSAVASPSLVPIRRHLVVVKENQRSTRIRLQSNIEITCVSVLGAGRRGPPSSIIDLEITATRGNCIAPGVIFAVYTGISRISNTCVFSVWSLTFDT